MFTSAVILMLKGPVTLNVNYDSCFRRGVSVFLASVRVGCVRGRKGVGVGGGGYVRVRICWACASVLNGSYHKAKSSHIDLLGQH